MTGRQIRPFSLNNLNTNSNYPVQVISAEHNPDNDGFVFNPSKDIATRMTADGSQGVALVTPQISAFFNGEEAKN